MRESQCFDTHLNRIRDLAGKSIRICVRRSTLQPIAFAAGDSSLTLSPITSSAAAGDCTDGVGLIAVFLLFVDALLLVIFPPLRRR